MQVKPAWHAHIELVGYRLQYSAKGKEIKRKQSSAKEKGEKEREGLDHEDKLLSGPWNGPRNGDQGR